MQTEPSRNRRGFAILIVLAVLAMASVIIATQLSSVRGQEYTQIRSVEEIKARDIAEHCLELADAYAVSFGNANNDFDRLLDPDGTITTAGTGDDFMPPTNLLGGTGVVASIPPSATDSKHRYRAFNVNISASGGTSGTCFIRYDDNADDTNSLFTAAVTSNNTAIEGADIDVAERDRDRSIITTVVGVVPQRSDLTEAYASAHGRVTVRRVRAMPIGVIVGAAIQAGGAVTFGNNSEVCGNVAGIIADSVTGACVCGVLNAQLISGSQGTTAGDCSCPTCASSTGSTITPGPRVDPTVTVPPFGSLLANESFGAVGSSANNIASPTYGAAVIYVRDAAVVPASYQAAGTTDVFVWDRFDNDTDNTLPTNVATQDCRDTSGLDPLPKPCDWDAAAVTCALGESPCWKLVARLDGVTGSTAIDVRGNGRVSHQNGNGDPNHFTPRDTPLPNTIGTRFWADFAPGSASRCDGSGELVIRTGAGNYTVFDNRANDAPHSFIIIDSLNSATTTVRNISRTEARVTVSTNTIVDIDNSDLCCATCDCPQACSGSTSMTPEGNGSGYAIRTDQPCFDSGSFGIVGNIMCATLDVARSGSGNCVVGGLIGLDAPGDIACDIPGETLDDPFCTSNANFCTKNNFELIGSLTAAGNICLKNNLDANGGIIQTEGNIGWKNNPNSGQIRAEGDVVAGNNSTITFNNVAGALENQGVASAIWMDTTW